MFEHERNKLAVPGPTLLTVADTVAAGGAGKKRPALHLHLHHLHLHSCTYLRASTKNLQPHLCIVAMYLFQASDSDGDSGQIVLTVTVATMMIVTGVT
jgi:hypothetical protein